MEYSISTHHAVHLAIPIYLLLFLFIATFEDDQALQYAGGVIAMMCCYCIGIPLCLLYLAVAMRGDRKGDHAYGKPREEAAKYVDDDGEAQGYTAAYGGLVDIPDKEQREGFRYAH
ncbi:hypothetical protein MKZ38_005888 [Zalerion maritima]|uniref:Uncharacterized protein n=1 Tax=Zalerion maritima TaxID=339359 RepID=A0AAD5WQ34_9PEZI|nr:hypothetical protein MKZ38_005888 [Zalerion maritima]